MGYKLKEDKQYVENLLTEDALTHGAVLDFPPPEGSTVSFHI